MKRLITGIQPSNKLTLGNYLGMMKNLSNYCEKYQSFIFVADLHAITSGQFESGKIAEYKKNLVAAYVAAGLDLKKITLFNQSDVLEHCNLGHILLCHTTMGELSRMTQFKDKSSKSGKNGTEYIPTGLLTYPTLMAADILLYDADVVPVGSDQKQHIELTRDIAERFNNKYGKTFVVPEGIIPEVGARIMDLQDPNVKMSKSNSNEKGTIFLLDTLADIEKKIMTAKTDNLNLIKFDKDHQPGIANLIAIHCSITGDKPLDIEKKFQGKNYGEFKKEIVKIVIAEIKNFQEKYFFAIKNFAKIESVLQTNAKKCSKIASKKLNEVLKKIGLKDNEK